MFEDLQKIALKTNGTECKFVSDHTDVVTLCTSTTKVLQLSVLFFNSTHEKCQHSNSITGGIFRGCTFSILKNGEVI